MRVDEPLAAAASTAPSARAPGAARGRAAASRLGEPRTTAQAASRQRIGKTGSSQRPKKRSCVPMKSRKRIGAGTSTERQAAVAHTSSPSAAEAPATSGTQPRPQVNVHR